MMGVTLDHSGFFLDKRNPVSFNSPYVIADSVKDKELTALGEP